MKVELRNIYKVYAELINMKEVTSSESSLIEFLKERHQFIGEFNGFLTSSNVNDDFTTLTSDSLELKYIWKKLVAKESTLSTYSIEGLKYTENEIDLIDQDVNDKDLLDRHAKDDVKSVRNMFNLYQGFKLDDLITFEYIKEIHKKIFISKKYNPGNFKAQDNFNEDAEGNITTYVSTGDVMKEMSLLIEFMNDKETDKHPLIKASLIHAYMISIHPFTDGNGRFTRFIVNKYISKIFNIDFFIDSSIDASKEYYIEALTNFRKGNITSIVTFHSSMILTQLHSDNMFIKKIINKIDKLSSSLGKIEIKKTKTNAIISFLLKNNVFSSKIFENEIDVTRVTAKKYLDLLVEANLVDKIKADNKRYIYCISDKLN